MKTLKYRRIISLLLLCVFLLTACSPNTDTTNKKIIFPGTPEKDMVTVDILQEPANLNSLMIQDGITNDVLRLCLSGLVKLDSNDEPQPDLAESWEISSDQTKYTFHLRKDAVWSNGDPVTASDYYFSWVTQMKKDTGSIFAFLLYEHIKNGSAYYEGKAKESDLGIQIIDDYTLSLEWERPIPYALYLLSLPGYQPVNQKFYEEVGAESYAKEPSLLLYNGPYVITEWVHDNSILLEQNPNYYDSANIFIPKVKLVMIADQNTRLNAFKTGMLDVCNISGDQIDQLNTQDAQVVDKYIDNSTWFFRFNTSNEIMSNVNIRKALAMSVDMKSLLDNVIKDGSVPADGLVPSSIAGIDGTKYTETRGSLFSYDLKKAKKHLNEGLSELGMTTADLKIDLLCSDTSYGQLQAEYIQQQWKTNLGIPATIRPLPWKARLEAETQGDFYVSTTGWAPDYNDPMTFLTLFTSDNPNNTGGYQNEVYDGLIVQAQKEPDFSKRQDLLIQAEKMLIDDMVIGPMYFTCTVYATSQKLTGLTRTGFQTFDLSDGAKIVPTN